MRRVLGLTLLVTLLLAARAPASDTRPLRALVVENTETEGWRGAEGLVPSLTAAGFQVGTLSSDASPAQAAADLIVLGTCASRTKAYAELMSQHAGGFADFMARGGVVLHLTQTPEFETTLPFLPEGLAVTRAKATSKDVRAVGRHPLTFGIERHEKDPARLEVKAVPDGRHPALGSFAGYEGFQVLAADRKHGARAVLLEAAVGRGRLVLTTLHLDKLDDPRNEKEPDVAGGENRKAAARFFDGLEGYVRAVRRGTAPDVVPTKGKAVDDAPWMPPTGPKLGDPTPVTWQLGLSDVAEYARREISGSPDKESLKHPKVVTVHGHALRDGGQYLPVSLRRGQMPTVLALRLPQPGQAASEIETTLDVHAVSPVKWSGTVSAHRIAGSDDVLVAGDYAIGGRTRARDSDKHRIENGTARVRGVFDPARGVMRVVRVDVEYDLRTLDAPRKEKPKRVHKRYAWRLESLRRARHPTFQHEVDEAIDAGVRHLRRVRQDNGRWKKHGAHDIGTTALVILTLSACDVPRDDPAVAEPLAWLFEQEPKKTYDRAVALMAVDEAFTPEGEAEALRRGQPVSFRRDLTESQRAWCQRTASALMKETVGKGGWNYPTAPIYVQIADMSNTQYAILALHAATKLGVEVDESTWLGVIRTFELVRDRKAPRGSVSVVREGERIPKKGETSADAEKVRHVAGFRYSTNNKKSWSSMTCAGIASLSIARHHLKRLKSPKLGARVEREIDAAILGAWAWLDQHWAVDRHPQKAANDWVGYYLYSLERAALLDRVTRIGGKDWYYEGACELIVQRNRDGGWKDHTSPHQGSRVVDTCFALLFLKRATAPITGR